MGERSRPAGRPISWHRRLEARVLLGVMVIAGISLASVAVVTGRVVRSHTFDRTRADLTAAQAAFATLIATRADALDAQTRLITTLPVFRAHMQSPELASDRNTMETMVKVYCRDLQAAMCLVADAEGRWLASTGVTAEDRARGAFGEVIGQALAGMPLRRVVVFDGAIYLVVSQPARFADEVLAAFVAAYRLDDDIARGLSRITRNQIALVAGRSIGGTSLDAARRQELQHALDEAAPALEGEVGMWQLGAHEYVGGTFVLAAGMEHGGGARLVLLEDWAPTEQFIDDIVGQLTRAGAVIFAMAVLISVVISRRMSRPLREIAERAGDIAAGEWDSRLPVRGTAEAVAMAEAFNDMTRSLSHWHQQASQRAEQLQAAYERYAAVTDSAPDSILSTDDAGVVVFCNRGAVLAFGYAEAEALGRPLMSLFDDADDVAAAIAATLDAGRPSIRTFDTHARRADGGTFPCELTVAVWQSVGTTCMTAIVRDVTERRQAEDALRLRDAQLQQSQKMEAIGRLASGVAHDFNNALSVIQGYTEEVMLCLGEGHEHHQDLGEVLKASQSAASLTRQLLAFSRKQTIDPQVVSVSEVIGNVQRMLQRLAGDQVDMRMSLPGSDDLVFADRGQIEQVIMNLCVNARDAMPVGGVLDVGVTRSVLSDPRQCERLGAGPGDFVTLTVADTGHGMDAATAAQIFEPFFTTKGVGKGTGLGLATVYGIVRQSGGAIDLETAPGRGTTFRIHLPAHAGASEDQAAEDALSTAAAGAGTVLLVEDEAPLRAILRRSLHAAGYAVLEAASGAEALDVSRRHRDDIDVLVTDMVMPGVDGVTLSQTIAAERPSTRVLFMSGRAADTFVRPDFDPSAVRFLQKPFLADVLCREVREARAA